MICLSSLCCFSQVRASNVACLAVGGTSCWLNYEQQMEHSLVVKVTDSGSPPLSVDFFANITLKNINDRPRDLKISGFKVHENQPVGTVVGKFSGTDEDIGQHLSYSLDNDDYGRSVQNILSCQHLIVEFYADCVQEYLASQNDIVLRSLEGFPSFFFCFKDAMWSII